MTKSLIAIAALAMLAGPAMAAKCDTANLALSGFFVEGSLVCNEAWLVRRASLIVEQSEKDCAGTDDKDLLLQGLLDFERELAEKGHAAACKALTSP
jgi:hypothetical protein